MNFQSVENSHESNIDPRLSQIETKHFRKEYVGIHFRMDYNDLNAFSTLNVLQTLSIKGSFLIASKTFLCQAMTFQI